MKESRRKRVLNVIGIILMVSLALSIVYAGVRFCIAPTEIAEGMPYEKVKSDYLLMLTQCILGLLVMMLPSLLSRKWKIVVPDVICILYYVFLYCAIFLGEVFEFYYLVPHWDTVLHAFSGAMLGALGFELVDFLNRDGGVKVSLSPLFTAVFAFSFALCIGALWEVYEFSFDALLGLNMQKHTTADGVPLVGTEALLDTMKDLIVDAIAAFAVVTVGFLQNTVLRRRSAEELPEKET
ncbi:MAG: hypothetical protein J6B77_06610 [Clostridia bacterium]|nr:hypothetical protein [Clostridia bacterium]